MIYSFIAMNFTATKSLYTINGTLYLIIITLFEATVCVRRETRRITCWVSAKLRLFTRTSFWQYPPVSSWHNWSVTLTEVDTTMQYMSHCLSWNLIRYLIYYCHLNKDNYTGAKITESLWDRQLYKTWSFCVYIYRNIQEI